MAIGVRVKRVGASWRLFGHYHSDRIRWHDYFGPCAEEEDRLPLLLEIIWHQDEYFNSFKAWANNIVIF